MRLTVSNFLHPYDQFVTSATLSIQQVLEGFELFRSSPLSNYLAGITLVALVVVLVLALLLLLTFAAAYTLGRFKGGVIFICVLIAPGALNIIGFLPDLQYGSLSHYHGSVGVLGSVMGLIPLLVMATAAGWSITILLYDTLGLTDKFRHYYDHLWFLTALTAAVFFVADNTASNNTKNLVEVSQVVRDSSHYLLTQVRRYQDYCRLNGLESIKSCQWSNYSQWMIGSYAQYTSSAFVQLGPDSSKGFFQPPREGELTDETYLAIRRELLEYNQKVCPVTQLSKISAQYAPLSESCEAPPFDFCTTWPDGPKDLVDPYISQRPVAIANECIIPNLVQIKKILPKLLADEQEANQLKNFRWWYFLFIALAVGGKIANSSTKLADINRKGSRERGVLLNDLRRFRVFSFLRAARVFAHVKDYLSNAIKKAKMRNGALRRLAKREARQKQKEVS